MKTVNALKIGIQSIFNKIGCNTPANMEMLGNEVRGIEPPRLSMHSLSTHQICV